MNTNENDRSQQKPNQPGVGSASTPELVHRILNRLSEQFADEALLSNLMNVLAEQSSSCGGYRLAFPVLVSNCRAYRCIALFAPVDHRIARLKDVQPATGTTHIFLFLAFENARQWDARADAITRIWPEQPDAAEGIL